MTPLAPLPRRSPVRSGLVALVLALGIAPPAVAQTDSRFDIRIERDTRPRTLLLSDLTATYTVTVRDRVTGGPPKGHVVFAQATNREGEKTPFFACGHMNDVDSRTPPGVFDCSVIVDHGGAWTFVAAVSEERTDREQSRAPVAQASVPFELATAWSTTNEVPGAEISAKVSDVAILFGHGAAAAGWFVGVLLLAALALPGARRSLSASGCHRLERRLDLIVRGTWVSTAAVVGSGVYLTLNQTAYDAPFSSAAVDAVFALPYGKPYFLALAAKVALYAVMVAASIPLVAGARRRMLSGTDAPAPELTPLDLEPLPVAASSGGVACDVRVRPAPLPLLTEPAGGGRLGAVVILSGAVGVAVCVTILKYLHELIESARGLL